jgi:hypothetical protein
MFMSKLQTINLIFLLSIFAMSGCTTVRREPASERMFNNASPVGFPSGIRYMSTNPQAIKSRVSEILKNRRATFKAHSFNILALSGGGAGGSFGAGALVGFSRQGKRPQFDIVTGVSAGALIAPFAFLGSSWDAQLDENFSGAHSDNFMQLRGVSMLSGPGVYKNEPLIEFVDHFVTEAMLTEVADQAALGRLLLVATTDLDKEETVIWDMGHIAAKGGVAAHNLFRDVLVASASIPIVFPPIIIQVNDEGSRYDEMHIDASATVPFFVAPALPYVVPLDPDGLKGANIYVIINGQLGAIPETTPLDTISIISRSFSASLQHRARAELALTSEIAQRYGMNLKLTAIPVNYPFKGPLDFHKASSQALFNYGAGCAQEGKLWTMVEQDFNHDNNGVSTGFPKQKNEKYPSLNCPLGDPIPLN